MHTNLLLKFTILNQILLLLLKCLLIRVLTIHRVIIMYMRLYI